jgi:hypothetical protein
MAKRRFFQLDEPLRHGDHSRPRTRREFIAQGFQAGMATVLGASILSVPGRANSLTISQSVIDACGIRFDGAEKIPFICFDLAGGANIAGSNVLVGGRGGQRDFLDTAGYSKLGLPSNMLPSQGSFIDDTLGLAFHSDSQFLRGILEKTSPSTQEQTNGAVIAARSENDTGNNPHNPMYGIHMAGARGSLLALCGSQSSESGGNSMAPAMLVNSEVRPTKIDRPSDVTGLVDVGDLVSLLSQDEVVAVMETMYHMSKHKMDRVATTEAIRQAVPCKYLESAGLAERYSDPASLNPLADPDIVGANGIFTQEEMSDGEFRKTASVMKMVIGGYAGAGTITMGGFDYHTGDRATGELRDLRAGRCMGACLEYAARRGKPLMMYVFSDGSVFSNGMIDDSNNGGGKGVWTGDSQQTAASFFLVYNPGFRPVLLEDGTSRAARHQQIGYMRPSADVETASSPAANNVNQLVQTVILNYMALHGEQGNFAQLFSSRGLSHGLGSTANLDALTAFQPIII